MTSVGTLCKCVAAINYPAAPHHLLTHANCTRTAPALRRYNNADIISPHINALAADGVKLTSHYVYRYCSPTRAALLTGRSPLALANVRENFIPITLPQGTDIGFTMLPERLATAGYISHQIGKW